MDIYDEMMESSCHIAASFPCPRFYESCAGELRKARALYHQSLLVSQCRDLVMRALAKNPSHGLDHAEKVAVEAAALAFAESARIGLRESAAREAASLAQLAGLLHDMRRGDDDHATSGARAAEVLLDGFPLSEDHRRYVVEAIANHEAFTEPQAMDSSFGAIVSDTLYDADKFRWGPDNFTATLWEMLRFAHASVAAVIPRFPEGMAGIARIRDTFRSRTGKIYGPEFIDLGLEIGDKIYRLLRERFADDLNRKNS
jgi:hypothetical protein